MIDRLKPTPDVSPSLTLDFILQRESMFRQARREDDQRIARLLQDVRDKNRRLSDVFSTLVDELKDKPTQYSLARLKKRDQEAKKRDEEIQGRGSQAKRRATSFISPEDPRKARKDSSRDVIISREDAGIPSTLEHFFLTLFSESEWRKICETEKRDTVRGEFGTQNVIETVLADEPRTRKFIRAVQAEAGKFKAPASVFDVGCGPFPILGLTAAMVSPYAKVTCIEKNPLSVRVAQAVVDKFVADGSIAPGQVTVKCGDALTESLPSKGSVDLFVSETIGTGLLEEQGPTIFSRYAECINPKHGSFVPFRAKLYATLIPTDEGVSRSADGKRRVAKYKFIINQKGQELPVIPKKEWVPLEGGRELSFTDIPKKIEGVLDFPPGVDLSAFDWKYQVAISAELLIDKEQKEKAYRYDTFITSHIALGNRFISVPKELKNEDPATLCIKFSFVPGGSSQTESRVEVVRKSDVR